MSQPQEQGTTLEALFAVLGEYETRADSTYAEKEIKIVSDNEVVMAYTDMPGDGITLFNRQRLPTPERLRAVLDALQWPKRGTKPATAYMLTVVQRDTIIAALRAYQELLEGNSPDMAWLSTIAGDSGEALTAVEIENLIETMNGG